MGEPEAGSMRSLQVIKQAPDPRGAWAVPVVLGWGKAGGRGVADAGWAGWVPFSAALLRFSIMVS